MYLGNKEMTMNSKLLNKVTVPSLTFVINVIDIEAVWFKLKAASKFHVLRVFFFFPLHMNSKITWFYCSGTKTLFITDHESHNTIHKFKNYFATVFSVFSFSNNKFNPNKPIMNFDAKAKIVKLATKFIEYIEDFDA